MKRIATVVLTIVAGLATMISLPSQAQDPAAMERPGVVKADVAVITATVESVDKANRTVTLRGPEGRVVTVKADESVRNFDQIAKGDPVRAEFYEETAIFVRSAAGEPAAGVTSTVGVAPQGARPGAVRVDTVELTAKVEAIDYAKRTVTLRGPQGNTRTLKVGEEVKRLDEVKVGDEIVVRHTQAVAIGIAKQ